MKTPRRATRAVVFLPDNYFQLSKDQQLKECGRLWDALAEQLSPEALERLERSRPDPLRRTPRPGARRPVGSA
ncbi:MAG: hypothetical protein ACOY3Y_01060 [Acidobacteriota bacterium]